MTDPSLRNANYRSPIVSLPDDSWHYIIDVFEGEFIGSLLSLQIEFSEGVAKLEAQVASVNSAAFLLALVRRHPHVERVEENIEIKAPFRSAGRDAADAAFDNWHQETASVPDEERLSLERYPHISVKGELNVGSDVVVLIYLEEEADEFTDGGPSVIDDVPAHWQTLNVDVVVDSAQLVFDEETASAKVKLRRGQRSSPAMIHAQVDQSAQASGFAQLTAQFYYEGRRCGFARRTFPLVRREKEKAEEIESRPDVQLSGDDASRTPNFTAPAQIKASLDASDFVVSINREGTDLDGTYRWVTYSNRLGSGRRQSNGQITLGQSTRKYAESLLKLCPTLEPGNHARTLKSIGEEIWGRTPPAFQEHYLSLVAEIGPCFPIQFYSDEPYVPWEMMCPKINGEGKDHLFFSHPVARWPSSSHTGLAQSFADGIVASFVPSYQDRDLPAAHEEGRWLRDNLEAVEHEPTHDALLNFLESPPEAKVKVVHFAGHGKCGNADSPSSIEMSEGKHVTVKEVGQSGVKLGRRDRSLFILNACEVGASTLELGMASGWASALTNNGFGGVLAPLWAVRDEHASKLVIGSLDLFLRSGETLAESVRRSRDASRGASTTSFAYVLYGDVMARA